MPIPKPQEGEGESTFIARCIVELTNEYEQDVAAAICLQAWDDKEDESESESESDD